VLPGQLGRREPPERKERKGHRANLANPERLAQLDRRELQVQPGRKGRRVSKAFRESLAQTVLMGQTEPTL
jgi:hypothetical protein